MSKFIDLTGKKFGRWTVVSCNGKNKWGNYTWLCKCDCGNKRVVNSGSLIKGLSNSCGCLNIEATSKANKKYNTYDLSGEFGIGYTSKGREFYFDLEDYDLIKDYCWFKNNGYMVSNIDDKKQSMHRYILGFPDYDGILQTDHINRLRYDNRKENLRIATNQENSFNKDKKSNNTTGHRGIYWSKALEKWCSQIVIDNKNIHLGYFINIKDAINARENAEIKYHGEFKCKDKV